jgi:hypothetical protein
MAVYNPDHCGPSNFDPAMELLEMDACRRDAPMTGTLDGNVRVENATNRMSQDWVLQGGATHGRIPEPATPALLGVGAAWLAARRRRG